MHAGDICSRNLVYVVKTDSLHKAIELMRKNSFSQVPVFDTTKPIGLISEDGLVKHMIEKDEKDLKNMKAENVMEPPPPVIDVATPAKALIPLVRFSKCALVSEKGSVVGIITVSDTLKLVE